MNEWTNRTPENLPLQSNVTPVAPVGYQNDLGPELTFSIRYDDTEPATERAQRAIRALQYHFERMGLEDAVMAASADLRELRMHCRLYDLGADEDGPAILTLFVLSLNPRDDRHRVEIRFAASGPNRAVALRRRVLSLVAL